MKSKIEVMSRREGMTLAELARKAGISSRALYKWRKVGIEKAQLGAVDKVARALDCSIEDLYER